MLEKVGGKNKIYIGGGGGGGSNVTWGRGSIKRYAALRGGGRGKKRKGGGGGSDRQQRYVILGVGVRSNVTQRYVGGGVKKGNFLRYVIYVRPLSDEFIFICLLIFEGEFCSL